MNTSSQDKLHGLMCIEKDNSAVKGAFFEDPGYPPASQVFSPGGIGTKNLGFHSHPARHSAKMIAHYQAGDPIAAYQLSGETLNTPFGGHLILPSPDDSGNCIEMNPVEFGTNIAGSCTKHISDLAVDCEGYLSIARYTARMYTEQTKGSVIAGTPAQTSISSGALLPIRLENGTASTTWDESSSTCNNALQQITYNILYNHTTILGISVETETTDIVEPKQLRQTFAVNFIPLEVDTSERSHDQNNIITRLRSGNPGYIKDKPTLGAMTPRVNHTTSYVIAQQSGFTVMDTGVGGQCSTSSPTGTTVGFANDVFVGCTQRMTRDELRDFCTSNSHPMITSHGVGTDHFIYPKWLQSSQNLLGIFGNADPLARNHWVKIESALDEDSYIVKSRNFVDAENRCIGMPSRLRYEILWTYVGNVDNKQAKILTAKKSYEDGPSLQHVLPPNESQPYSFVTTVSWTFLPPKSSIVKSPPPLYIFSLPYDVFYPFQME